MVQRLIGGLRSWGLNRDIVMLGLARAVDSFGGSLMIILIPLFVEHFDISVFNLASSTVIGIVLSVYGFTNTSVQPIVGVFIDRIGRNKPFIGAGLILYSVATVLFVWIHSFPGVVALRIVQGVGIALTIPSSLALMTAYTKPVTRGTAMSFYNVMRLVGFSAGPLVGGYLLTVLDFGPVLFLGASAGILGATLVHFLVREVQHSGDDSEGNTIDDLGSYFDTDLLDFYVLAFANVTMALSIALVAPLENEFIARLNQSSGEFGLAFSASIITIMIVQIPLGRIADLFGRKLLIVTGLVVLIPSTIWIAYVGSTTQFVLARMCQGIGVASVAAPTFALGGDKSTTEKRGREMSLLTMAFGLGIALGPLFAGIFAGQFGFATPFLVGAGLLVTSSLLVSLLVSRSELQTTV